MHPRTLPDQPTTQAGAFAESEDGRQLLVAGRGDPPLRAGDLVTIEIDGDQVIGQLTGRRASDGVTGGLVLGVVAQGGNALQVGPGPVFGPTPVTAAADADLAVLQGEVAIPLPIGTWTTGQVTVPAVMDGAAFNRHTFLCGQSGSGKTYALGLVLERLLAETDLRIVVADPNSDFVHVNEPSGLAEPGQLERMLRHGPHILGADATGRTPLRMRFTALPRAAKAAVLRLDPLADRDEYDLFIELGSADQTQAIDELVARLRTGDAREQRLAQRIVNLGLEDWEVWAGQAPAVTEVVGQGPGLTVLDLASFADPVEPVAVMLSLVENLWERRTERRPTLLVIDEAHNLCPAHPEGPVQVALVERLVQIAAEGRKYGLWLLLSTQRPSKIHPQVLSQCDNLMLMRMNSGEDVDELARTFGFAPREMVAGAVTFRQGEMLAAGRITPVPSVFRMGDRWTRQGGSDVSVPAAGH